MSYGGAPTGLGTHGQLQVSLVPGTLVQFISNVFTKIDIVCRWRATVSSSVVSNLEERRLKLKCGGMQLVCVCVFYKLSQVRRL